MSAACGIIEAGIWLCCWMRTPVTRPMTPWSWRRSLSIKLIWLPKRSPNLNPMDRLWGEGKDVVSANRQYATIEDQVSRFLEYLESLSSRETLHTAGVLSKHFWLRSRIVKKLMRTCLGLA